MRAGALHDTAGTAFSKTSLAVTNSRPSMSDVFAKILAQGRIEHVDRPVAIALVLRVLPLFFE